MFRMNDVLGKVKMKKTMKKQKKIRKLKMFKMLLLEKKCFFLDLRFMCFYYFYINFKKNTFSLKIEFFVKRDVFLIKSVFFINLIFMLLYMVKFL